jgi:hypothetical protein
MQDVKWLDMLVFESGAIYLFDKSYIEFFRLQRIAASGAFFVTRAKENLRFARQADAALRAERFGRARLAGRLKTIAGQVVRQFDASLPAETKDRRWLETASPSFNGHRGWGALGNFFLARWVSAQGA